MTLPLLAEPWRHDLSPFGAQLVRSDQPWAFDQTLINAHRHARHRLRCVTYNYGDGYLGEYLLREEGGSGMFIERHEFVQAITPMTPQCGGFVVLGREVLGGEEGQGSPPHDNHHHDHHDPPPQGKRKRRLELLACPIPYGHTLLVDPGCIHGDSALTGLYAMAMTGNHIAMQTADSVFLKQRGTRRNVRCLTEPALSVVPGLTG
jgi:hypothetical protein